MKTRLQRPSLGDERAGTAIGACPHTVAFPSQWKQSRRPIWKGKDAGSGTKIGAKKKKQRQPEGALCPVLRDGMQAASRSWTTRHQQANVRASGPFAGCLSDSPRCSVHCLSVSAFNWPRVRKGFVAAANWNAVDSSMVLSLFSRVWGSWDWIYFLFSRLRRDSFRSAEPRRTVKDLITSMRNRRAETRGRNGPLRKDLVSVGVDGARLRQ